MRIRKCWCIIVLIFCIFLSGCSSFQEGFKKGYEDGRKDAVEQSQEKEEADTP